jgi:hypothetical protein
MHRKTQLQYDYDRVCNIVAERHFLSSVYIHPIVFCRHETRVTLLCIGLGPFTISYHSCSVLINSDYPYGWLLHAVSRERVVPFTS